MKKRLLSILLWAFGFGLGIEALKAERSHEPSVELHTAAQIKADIDSINTALSKLPVSEMLSAPWSLGWRQTTSNQNTLSEIKLQLRRACAVDMIALFPSVYSDDSGSRLPLGFPKRFQIFSLNDKGEQSLLVDFSQADYLIEGCEPQIFEVEADELSTTLRIVFIQADVNPTWRGREFIYAMSEIYAFSGEENVALRGSVEVIPNNPGRGDSFGYVWDPDALVDGATFFAPLDKELKDPSTDFFQFYEEISVLFDLRDTTTVDAFRIWPVSFASQFNFPTATGSGFPRKFTLEVLPEESSKRGTVLYESPRFFPRPGQGPYSDTFNAATGRYFRFKFRNPVPEFRELMASRIAIGEIELLSRGQGVSRNNPPKVYLKGSSKNKGDRVISSAIKLVDGSTNAGRILSERAWVEQLAKQYQLGRYLNEKEDALVFALAQDRARLRTRIAMLIAATIVLAFLVVIMKLLQVIKIKRVHANIASNLHDEIGANLSSIAHTQEMIEMTIPNRTELQDELLSDSRETARQTAVRVRKIVCLLEDSTHSNAMTEDLEETAQQFLKNIPYTITFKESKRLNALKAQQRWHLYLFFKEALNNVLKHSGATRVEINTRKRGKYSELHIVDNGKGVEKGKIPPRHLKLRADALKAKMTISTAAEGGTHIILSYHKELF